ncbi:MAG: uroporphyrinogen decarboxylase family protein [Caldilinea sp.]
MQESLTSRERVRIALPHQEADRVPYALGGGPYGVVDDLYFRLLALFNLGEPVVPFRQYHNISYQDDRLWQALGTDIRYVYPGASPTSPSRTGNAPNHLLDALGQQWVRAFPYYYAGPALLTHATEVGDIDRLVTWPDPDLPEWTAGVHDRAKWLRETTDCWITARMVASHGPFQSACDLRGTEQFLMDMVDGDGFAEALIERITTLFERLLRNYLLACGPYIDMIELPGDDYAGNTNLLISPRLFRQLILPALKRLVAVAKQVRPDLVVMLHSDGAITKLLPDLVSIGVDVIHPLEPLPAMDLPAIKTEFGKQVSFMGGIDISHAMRGTRQEVTAEVQRRICQLAPGGGYILTPANHLQADVPAENVVELVEAARRFGRYPIT